MDYLENKYIGLLSISLRNFKRKSGNNINFSCPICGDSESDKRKARGYIYTKIGKTLYHCHNCNTTISFDKFLKTVNFQLYSEFSLERLRDSKTPEQLDLEQFVEKMKKPIFLKDGPLKDLKKISQLDCNHPAKIFIADRKIPNPFHAKLFWCPTFYAWTNSIVSDKFAKNMVEHDHGRIIIPFISTEKKMHAFQGRSISSSQKQRYITIVNDETVSKVYGLDTINFSNKVYCFEGPFDSMFLPNAIATAGGDLVSTIYQLPKENIVVVCDNEPRSIHTKKKIDKAIINGYSVCIWPENFMFKDVNDAILGGLSSEFVRYIIDQHTFKDLKAKLTLNTWSKV